MAVEVVTTIGVIRTCAYGGLVVGWSVVVHSRIPTDLSTYCNVRSWVARVP